MPLDLKAYKSKTRTVTVPVGEESIVFSYFPAVFTPNRQKEMSRLKEDDADLMAKYLKPLLSDWDLTDEGKKVPITTEGIGSLSFELLNLIFQGIVDDVTLKAKDPNDRKA